MSTTVTPTTQGQTADSSTASRIPQKSLNKDDFLSLMITQLKNQDPMEPLKDTDSIAQMAQFSSLEQMQNLNTSVTSLIAADQLNALESTTGYAVSLIGKNVGYLDADGTTQKSGNVDSMQIVNGVPQLSVGGKLIGVDQITEVKPQTV